MGRASSCALRAAWLLGLASCAGAASASTPFQAGCEAAAAQAVTTFATGDNGYRIDNTLSFRALTQMKQPAPNGYVLGLTRTESRVAIQVDGALLPDPDGDYECVLPRIAVTLYYLPIVVYVSSEFKQGSCAYREVLAHEMRHLKSYLDYLPKVEERVRAKLGRRFAGKPLYARDGEARGLLQQEIDGRWMPYIKAEMARVERQQAAIDSPGEYRRLSKVCQGQVQSFIRSTRHPNT